MAPRRTRYEALQRLAQATWLVVRDRHQRPLTWRELSPGADLRAALQAARAERMVAGWACDEIGTCSFFFAKLAGDRHQVGIERYDPAGPGHPGHCEPAPPKA